MRRFATTSFRRLDRTAGASGRPSNQTIAHNTIVTAGNGIEVRDVFGPVVIASTRDAGAYKFRTGGNPGWTIVAGFKTNAGSVVRPNPPTDVRVQ